MHNTEGSAIASDTRKTASYNPYIGGTSLLLHCDKCGRPVFYHEHTAVICPACAKVEV